MRKVRIGLVGTGKMAGGRRRLAVAVLRRVAGEDEEVATFDAGLRAQRVLDAIAVANREGRWMGIIVQ